MPLTLTLPAALDTWRETDTRTLLTWVGPANKIRFLLPAAVYRPGGDGTPEEPPGTYREYLTYLREHSRHGATWRDEKPLTVDGRAATLLTGTTEGPLDGSLGCPKADGNADRDCYGLQPEYELRVAVIDAPGRPLLAWSTIDTTRPQDRTVAFPRFEGMLRTLEFR
ncbi:hypothetical protein [Streptomyces bicolor]|uniref:hypothetical protein n=1 Tax=Streptomyces bicolor TaxID=66874 RepID=UPI0004E0C398|nr:hypothetical protein [Streptomyces bicolor]